MGKIEKLLTIKTRFHVTSSKNHKLISQKNLLSSNLIHLSLFKN